MNLFNKVFGLVRSNSKVGIRKNANLIGIKTTNGLEVVPVENWDDLRKFITSLPFVEVKVLDNQQLNVRRKD